MRDQRTIGVVIARRPLRGPWADHAWLPVAVLPAAPDLPVGTSLGRNGDDDTFYAGETELFLYAQATGHYRDNLATERPSVWVALRLQGEGAELASATLDPYEGEALAESIGDVLEAVPMPSDIQAWLSAFVETFHVERPFFKRQRDRADPEALGRRAPLDREDDE